MILSNVHTLNVPSATFAIQTALYDLLSKKNNQSFSAFINANSLSEVKSNGVYNLTSTNQYKVIKVKYYVGKRNVNYKLKDNNLLKLINKRKFREESFGRFLCYTVRTKYLANIVRKKLSKNQYFLIK